MEVSDIKKYIEYGQQQVIDETNLVVIQGTSLAILDNIKSMLDELEPKENNK